MVFDEKEDDKVTPLEADKRFVDIYKELDDIIMGRKEKWKAEEF